MNRQQQIAASKRRHPSAQPLWSDWELRDPGEVCLMLELAQMVRETPDTEDES